MTTVAFGLAGCAIEPLAGSDADVGAPTHGSVYVVAHMTNTPDAARWAVSQGANGVEVDLRFDEGGSPKNFLHDGVCDCACSLGEDDDVCAVLAGGCQASTPVAELLATLAALPELALVIVDSKVTGDVDRAVQEAAGMRAAETLGAALFGRGYGGKLVLAAPKSDAAPYLGAAARAFEATAWASRVSYTFDEDGDDAEGAERTLASLAGLTSRRAYGVGVSACSPGDFVEAVARGAEVERGAGSTLTYVWTLDAEDAMRRHFDAGARAIVTNEPKKLDDVVRSLGRVKARAAVAR